jgi:hypothetical protein
MPSVLATAATTTFISLDVPRLDRISLGFVCGERIYSESSFTCRVICLFIVSFPQRFSLNYSPLTYHDDYKILLCTHVYHPT